MGAIFYPSRLSQAAKRFEAEELECHIDDTRQRKYKCSIGGGHLFARHMNAPFYVTRTESTESAVAHGMPKENHEMTAASSLARCRKRISKSDMVPDVDPASDRGAAYKLQTQKRTPATSTLVSSNIYPRASHYFHRRACDGRLGSPRHR